MGGAPNISFIVPTYHSRRFFERCFSALKGYPDSELIVVDNHSGEQDVKAAELLGARTFTHGPDQSRGRVFGAPFQRDFGARQAVSPILYFVDVDMIIDHRTVDEAIELISRGADAVIVPEESFGEGFWARCKWLERRCYWGDDSIEAPRIVRRDVYLQIGGFDGELGADDWDFARRLRAGGYSIARTRQWIMHDEGRLKLSALARKRFLYSRHIVRYISKHRSVDIQQATPFRSAYLRNWRLLITHPVECAGMVVMKAVEFGAAAAGIALSLLEMPEIRMRS